MQTETPAEAILRWLNEPGLRPAIVRWVALIPGALCIFLISQLMFFIALSWVVPGRDPMVAPWAMHMLNAAFVPFLVIAYGTPVAPSFRRPTSVALALFAAVLVGISRLAYELSHPGLTPWRYAWLAIAAALFGTSAWFGIRGVYRKEALREQCGKA